MSGSDECDWGEVESTPMFLVDINSIDAQEWEKAMLPARRTPFLILQGEHTTNTACDPPKRLAPARSGARTDAAANQ